MRWPPYLLKMRFRNPEHAFGFWLPICLIWPIVLIFLLAVFIILLPFALLTVIFTWRSDWLESLLMAVPAVFRLLGNLSGMVVDVEDDEDKVYIEFI